MRRVTEVLEFTYPDAKLFLELVIQNDPQHAYVWFSDRPADLANVDVISLAVYQTLLNGATGQKKAEVSSCQLLDKDAGFLSSNLDDMARRIGKHEGGSSLSSIPSFF